MMPRLFASESASGVLNSDAGSVGKTLFVRVRVDGLGSYRFARFDDLYLKGTPAPEPGSLALLDLRGLLVASRRRRA